MKIQINKYYKSLYQNKTRYYLLYGGRGGGRSYSASQKVIFDTITKPYSRIAVMRYILGDVRSSIWQEIKDRVEDYNLPSVQSDQAMRYSYNNNLIEGKGFKQSTGQNKAKLKSLTGYNTIVIEEADEVKEDDFDQLDSSIRTQKADNQIILLFNMPDKNHWIIKRWFNLIDTDIEGYFEATPREDRTDTTFIEADYTKNIKNMADTSINLFESYKKSNPDYYYNMIKGYVSEGLKGRVFKDWQPISLSEYEALDYSKQYGMDFGFSNDPTAMVEIKRHNNNLYIKELIYSTGLTNQDIAEKIKELGINEKILCDPAEPKSIEELKRLGIYAHPAIKGQGSVNFGIDKIKSFNVFYVEQSTNLIFEYQNYTYKINMNKEPTNTPVDKHNHLIDSLRYSLSEEEFNIFIV